MAINATLGSIADLTQLAAHGRNKRCAVMDDEIHG
jgi:hypothetical protein